MKTKRRKYRHEDAGLFVLELSPPIRHSIGDMGVASVSELLCDPAERDRAAAMLQARGYRLFGTSVEPQPTALDGVEGGVEYWQEA